MPAARGRHHLGAAAAEDVGPNAGQGVAVARRALQALGDSDIPDEPSHAEDWEVAVKALSLARQAAGQAAKAAQLIGQARFHMHVYGPIAHAASFVTSIRLNRATAIGHFD